MYESDYWSMNLAPVQDFWLIAALGGGVAIALSECAC